MMPVDFAVFKIRQAVAALANVDFDRTKAAADRFERNQLRLLVRLPLAQVLLQMPESVVGFAQKVTSAQKGVRLNKKSGAT
jgi:hypothetical protein